MTYQSYSNNKKGRDTVGQSVIKCYPSIVDECLLIVDFLLVSFLIWVKFSLEAQRWMSMILLLSNFHFRPKRRKTSAEKKFAKSMRDCAKLSMVSGYRFKNVLALKLFGPSRAPSFYKTVKMEIKFHLLFLTGLTKSKMIRKVK